MNRSLNWKLLALLLTLLVSLPLFAIFFHAFNSSGENLQHLWNNMLGSYVRNSGILVLGTLGFALFFALPSAWIVAHYQFRGQSLLQWLLCLPLAMPAYLNAYLYTDLLDYSGAFQASLRGIFGWQRPQDYWFPQIRSLYGASFVLALVLYPYIFLLVRVALLEQSEHLLQSGRLLGASSQRLLRQITLPLIRPAIMIGVALVAMETLGDYGTVYYFAIPTLTTAIYDAWLGYQDLGSASLIAMLILAFVFLFMFFEHYHRRQQKTYQRHIIQQKNFRPLRGWRLWLAQFWCWGLLTLAFFLPLARLIYWAYAYFAQAWNWDFLQFAQNSLLVSGISALLCVLIALVLHFSHRLTLSQRESRLTRAYLQISSLGYALPGTVLAIGLLSPLLFADHQLHSLFKQWQLPSLGLVFSGSIFALICAYCIRFLAMAIGSLESSLARLPPSLDMASRTLGQSNIGMLFKVHLPLLKKGIFTALLMVFIESMKELNASLLLRPFNFDTLATHVFTFTSDEQLERASLPAIILVLVGLLPVIWLTRSMISNAKHHENSTNSKT